MRVAINRSRCRKQFVRSFFAAFMVASVGGCAALPRQPAVPESLTMRAVTPGVPDSRYWPDIDPRPLFRESLLSAGRELHTYQGSLARSGAAPPITALALSGGGDAGAFGAGLLVGWSAQGTRPQFQMVTGISAGALIAPFAFLGPQYDPVLSHVCGSIGPRDVFHLRNVLMAFASDGVADDRPLEALIAKYVTAETLSAIAREYAKGRLLLIGTTDLDARQRVVWNMGAIASSSDPRALTLFRKIVLASTSIPGVFPPVMIDVEVDGTRYQEMHVDGGVLNQAFLLPPLFLSKIEGMLPVESRERDVYVIRNGYLTGKWVAVPRRTAKVARRAFDSLIEAQVINDLYRLEMSARDDRERFHFAYIGHEFEYPHKREFEAEFIQQLFEFAYRQGARGYPWQHELAAETQTIVDDVIAVSFSEGFHAPFVTDASTER